MPVVNVKMLEGRTADQKRQLVAAITESMASICHADPELTMVIIEDIPKDHWARGGIMLEDRMSSLSSEDTVIS